MTGLNTTKELKQNRIYRRIMILLGLLILLILFFIQLIDFGPTGSHERDWVNLPVSIRATSQADYNPDPDSLVVQPVGENIFVQIIRDFQGTGNEVERLSTLEVSLSMPVPSMTPNGQNPASTLLPVTSTSQIAGTVTSLATPTLPVTASVLPPTSTSTMVYATPSPTPTSTPASVATKRPKNTRRPPPTKKP